MRFLKSRSVCKAALAAVVALEVLSNVVDADMYLHFPPGSNDRNRERNENRNNDQRMCDTQNNDKGGYPWCGNASLTGATDGYQFYAGSIMRIEWTNQHSCGPNSNAWCNVILQYSCDSTNDGNTNAANLNYRAMPNIRDGWPTGPLTDSDGNQNNAGQYYRATFNSTGQNTDGTNTIPCPSGDGCQDISGNNFPAGTSQTDIANFYNSLTTLDGEVPIEYGYHETYQFYRDFCMFRSRNKGLYTADQGLGNTARSTRQNPGGSRHGLECPEERDYYPWWNPSPWRDIAILVSDLNWCNYFQSNSQNVAPRYYCYLNSSSTNSPAPLTEAKCTTAGGTWMTFPSWGLAAPLCQLHPIARDNHLGNVAQVDANGNPIAGMPRTAYFDWTVPNDVAGKSCVVRVRYNISSSDYPQVNAFDTMFKSSNTSVFWSSAENCNGNNKASYCYSTTSGEGIPLYNRPYVFIDGANDTIYPRISIAYNSDQVGRTFQDRSYVLRFLSRPAVSASAKIYNLNTRGRRGNIVQCYPAVENDFVPNYLEVTTQDYVHIQFCGSDFNPANNPNNGEGWQFSTRSNFMQNRNSHTQFPLSSKAQTMFSDFATMVKYTYVGITDFSQCVDYEGDNSNSANNQITNCGKLNSAPARFDGGLQQFSAGTYQYVSTRNNNFSNRSQKGTLVVFGVDTGMNAGAIAGVVAGVVGVIAVGSAGVAYYIKKRPGSKLAQAFTKSDHTLLQ